MKTNIVLASHHNMAKGLKDTCNYLTNNLVDIHELSAYVDMEKDIDEEVAELMGLFSHKDTVIVLVDMLGGSISQKFHPYMSENVHIICGMNLPLALSLILQIDMGISKEDIKNTINEARDQIVYLNEFQLEIHEDDE